MLDHIGEVAWILTPILGGSTFVWSLWEFRRLPVRHRVIASVLFGTAVAWLCFAVGIQILLRDGLGPDSIPSSGDVAVARAFDGSWLALAGALVPVALGAWTVRRARPASNSQPRDSRATG
jgi:hypothetical protein